MVRRLAPPAVLLLVAAGLAVIVLVNNGPHVGSGAASAAAGAATVQRRDLMAADTEPGTLSYADQRTVFDRLSGTITWMPAVGTVIHPGQTLFTVDDDRVLLLDGRTPAYRDLSPSDHAGPDVYELNRNLVARGYDPNGIVLDDSWQPATTAGVRELQHHLDEPETGTLTLGRIVFLPGPQMVQTVLATVGSTAGASAAYRFRSDTPRRAFVDYSAGSGTTSTGAGTTSAGSGTTSAGAGTTSTGAAPSTTATTTAPGGPTPTAPRGAAPAGDILSRRTLDALLRLIEQQQRELRALQRASSSRTTPSQTSSSSPPAAPRSSTTTSSSSGGSGSGGGGGGGSGAAGSAVALLSTSSTMLVVTVELSPSIQSEAQLGERVTVAMPDGSTEPGRVTEVSPVAQRTGDSSGAGGGGASGSGGSVVPVTVTLDRPAHGGGLDEAVVSVNFVRSRARNVLSVPVTALLAISASSFAVQEASRPRRLIMVHTGLFAAGYVAVSGPGLHPGLRVTDSQG